jgi:iron complex outermembrane recepter protein
MRTDLRWSSMLWWPALVVGTLIGGAASSAIAAPGLDPDAAELEEETVLIIGSTPDAGYTLPAGRTTTNVQAFSATDLKRTQVHSVADLLDRNATGVVVNSNQGNEFQPDLQYRGFTASPLLGTPVGLAVFQDGVRVNEAFGDVVNFDLIPTLAISNVQLLPGVAANYGLNSLGGALAISTKGGRTHAGSEWSAAVSDYGQRTLGLAWGHAAGLSDTFVAADLVDGPAYTRFNASRIARIFLKQGLRIGAADIDLSYTRADNRLNGLQLLPASFSLPPTIPYTRPDLTRNRLDFAVARLTYAPPEGLGLSGSMHARRLAGESYASDVNPGYGQTDPLTGSVDTASGQIDSLQQLSRTAGASALLSLRSRWRLLDNRFEIGGNVQSSRIDVDRRVRAAVLDGTHAGVPAGPYLSSALAIIRTGTGEAFLSDQLLIGADWTLTGALRYAHTTARIADRSGAQPGLNGDYGFARPMLALGASTRFLDTLTAFANYNQGLRAPTPAELTCANAQAPCTLPDTLTSDPPLRPVRSRGFELGVRGPLAAASDQPSAWSAAWYRTDLLDEIGFVSTPGLLAARGYFRNIGSTRREGLELRIDRSGRKLQASASLALLDATYRSGFTEWAPANASADASGIISIRPGAVLPGLPRASARLSLDYAGASKWSWGLGAAWESARYARGDENRADPRGRLPSFAVLNARHSWQATTRIHINLAIDNALGARYANSGALANNVFSGPGMQFDGAHPRAELFHSVSAPRTFWLSIRIGNR